MRLFRISLAVKYRLLFGTAVILIIGAALYVPWFLLDGLVLEQPFREAQRIADDYFRLALVSPPPGAAEPGRVHGLDMTLLPERTHRPPQFIRTSSDPAAPGSVARPENLSPFALRAFQAFARQPKSDFFHTTAREDAGRWYHYAHAIRVSKRCLSCHADGQTATPYRENELAGIITVSLPADQFDGQLLFNRLWIAAAGVLAGILAILVFYVIMHRFILSPIHELRRVALEVAEGRQDARSDVHTGDEFEQLSENMNTMLERLRASQDELRRANRLLDQKLGEMAETNVALYESNRVKNEFIANVSHELRTPLTSIIGFAELLREGPHADSNGKASRYAENILISGRILLEIINDLLDLAKIEAGKVVLHIESLSVADLCRTLVDFMRPQADRKRIDIDVETDPHLPPIQTDPGRLRQVLFNLLSNAIKFTPEHGRIRVVARRFGDDAVRVAVTDNGPGIAPEMQGAIFEKFRQIDQSVTREHTGTGLGLAIARELTDLLGGAIGLDSQPGHGSTFWITLPLAAPQELRERKRISLV